MPSAASTDQPTRARLTREEEHVARTIVAAHRARLEWLVRVPEWEGLLETGIEVLGLPGQRQGIAWAAAIGALPLENKYQLVRWAMEQFRRHLSGATARRLCQVVGVEPFDSLDVDELLTASQWADLGARVLFRLGQEHRRYKHAQQMLFIGFQHLVDRVVLQAVFAERHRADSRQEGCLGLLHAIDRTDAGDGDFAGFATCWIRRSVRNHLMRQRLPVYAPVNLISRAARLDPANDGGPRGGTRLETLLFECLKHPTVSLDEPGVPGGPPLAEGIADTEVDSPAEAAARADLRGEVTRALGTLTGKQREVVARRFGFDGAEGCTLAGIARAAGISHQQAGMRARRALQRIESALEPLAAELHGGA